MLPAYVAAVLVSVKEYVRPLLVLLAVVLFSFLLAYAYYNGRTAGKATERSACEAEKVVISIKLSAAEKKATELNLAAETLRASQAEALARTEAEYRERESLINRRIYDVTKEYEKAKAALHTANSGLSASIATGASGVRVYADPAPAADPSMPTSPGNPCPTSGVNGTGTCELRSDVAARLFSIAERCDETALRLTALQGWVRAVSEGGE